MSATQTTEQVLPAGFVAVPRDPSYKLISDLAHEWAYNVEEACESYQGFIDVCAKHGFAGSEPSDRHDIFVDMLEALKLVQKSTEWSCMERDTQNAVNAAISKATGEAAS